MTERAGPMQSDAFDTSPLVNRASVVYGVSVLAWIPLRHFQWACVGIAIADYLFLITQCLDRLESGSACGAFTYLNGRTRVLVTSGLMCYSPLPSMLRLCGVRPKSNRFKIPRPA